MFDMSRCLAILIVSFYNNHIMLEQHPVPQNVTSFQFKLIGDMTLKQFGYLAGGGILALASYNLPLPDLFRWPLVGIFALGGIGFAFVPIEERPMDVWFISFIKSVYSPTLYVWQREATVVQQQNTTPALTIPNIPHVSIAKNASSSITNMFSRIKPPTLPQFRINKLNIQKLSVSAPKTNTSTPKGQNNMANHTQQSHQQSTTHQTSPQNNPTQNVQNTHHTINQPEPQTQQNSVGNISTKPTLEEQLKKALEEKKQLEEDLKKIKSVLPYGSKQNQKQQNKVTQSPAPQQNVLSGVVKQKTGDPLHSILITVKDTNGIPIRALKTNKLGQFFSATPLPNGTYTIEVEDPKNVFFFQSTQITFTGEKNNPIIIVAKSKQDLERQKLEQVLFGTTSKP